MLLSHSVSKLFRCLSLLLIAAIIAGCTPKAPNVQYLKTSGYGIASLQVRAVSQANTYSSFCPFYIARKEDDSRPEYNVVKQVYSPYLHGMKLKQGRYYIVDVRCKTPSGKSLQLAHDQPTPKSFIHNKKIFHKAITRFDVIAGEVVDIGALHIMPISDTYAKFSINDLPTPYKKKRFSYNPAKEPLIKTRLMVRVQD